MFFADFRHATLDRGGIRRIQTEGFGVQLGGEGVEPILITRHEGQLTTTRRQLPRQRRTDAAGRAKNHHPPIFK